MAERVSAQQAQRAAPSCAETPHWQEEQVQGAQLQAVQLHGLHVQGLQLQSDPS